MSSSLIKLGIVGAGAFSKQFIAAFQRHPGVDEVTMIVDPDAARVANVAKEFGVPRTGASWEDAAQAGCNALAIYTPRHTHTPIAIAAMKAGLHVFSAVPASTSLEQLAQLVKTTGSTRRVFMSGETSYYYPEVVYCREEYRSGRWGRFVHAEAQYIHDMATWGPHFRQTFGERWRRFAGLPPMLYGTHSFSMPLSITGARVLRVSAHGFRDQEGDGIYGPGENDWENPFSNTVALAQTSDGGSLRIGEFRRLGWFAPNGKEVMMPQFYCTGACFEEHTASSVVVGRTGREGGEEARWSHQEARILDVTGWVNCPYFEIPPADREPENRFYGLAAAHPHRQLPPEFKGLKNGHNGSHLFLVNDFVRACVENKLPPCHAWDAARWTAPGLVAHESASIGGALLDVPDFGSPPSDWPLLEQPARGVERDRPTFSSVK